MLKQITYFALLVLLAGACKNGAMSESASQKADSTLADSLNRRDTIAPRLVIMRDSTLYSKDFLIGIHDNSDSISLIDNYIIDKRDTVYFPDYFERGKQYVFEKIKDSVDIKLQIFNCTYMKVQFIFSSVKNGKLLQQYHGEAYLSPAFYLASGTDDDDADSTAYSVHEYSGENEKYAYQVSIGSKDDEVLCRFTAYAKDSMRDKGFRDCPTLRCPVKYVPKHPKSLKGLH